MSEKNGHLSQVGLEETEYDKRLDEMAEKIVALQEKFSIWEHGVGHGEHGAEKAKKEVLGGYETTCGGPISFSVKFPEYDDQKYRKDAILHKLRERYEGRDVWLFFALPKELDYSESENREKAYQDAKNTLYKYDNLPAGEASKGNKHWIHQSRVIGWMDASGNYYSNPKFDAEKLAQEYKDDGY